MAVLSWLFGTKPKSASVAKERLQLIIAHERSGSTPPNFLPALQAELVAVISKYVHISAEDIKVNLQKQGNMEVLEVNIVLPENNK